jgi:hypothetical protein
VGERGRVGGERRGREGGREGEWMVRGEGGSEREKGRVGGERRGRQGERERESGW